MTKEQSSSSASSASQHLRRRNQPFTQEGILLQQLEGLRKGGRRGPFRAFWCQLDNPRVIENGSLRVMEAFVRAAAACHESGLAWGYLQKLLEEVDTLPGEGASKWTPRWDTFSLVMRSCRKGRDVDGLLKVFKASLPFNGFQKTVLLNMLLAGLCENGHMDRATFYLEVARSKWGVEPNEVSWNTLLGWAMRSGHSKLVEDLGLRMQEMGVQGDVTTSNIRLQHLLARRPEEALRLFEELKMQQERYLQEIRLMGDSTSTPSMDLVTLNTMVTHLARSRGYDKAKAMIEQVRRTLGIEARAVTHNILLDSLLKSQRIDEALEYFYDVVALAGASSLNPSSYAAFPSMSMSSSRPRRNDTRGDRQSPRTDSSTKEPVIDSTTYDILLNGLVQNGRVSTAVVVYHMMQKGGFRPTIYTYAALLRLQKTTTDVYRIWSKARVNCSKLSLPFFNLLIHELGQVHNDLEGACCAFRAILRSGLRPNTISYNSLLSALIKDVNGTVPATLPGKAAWGPIFRDEDGGGGEYMAKTEEGEGEGLAYFTQGGNTAVPKVTQATLEMLDALNGRSNLEVALAVLRSMYGQNKSFIQPNARTFTILMAGLSKADLGPRGTALCVALYREAEAQGVEANGILCHALLRGFGSDAGGALSFFKKELRPKLKLLMTEGESEEAASSAMAIEEARPQHDDGVVVVGGHLFVAYLALLHICGAAGRPDLALQLFYAMQRDGLRRELDVRAWEAYQSGKESRGGGAGGGGSGSNLLMSPYELLLESEAKGWEGQEGTWRRIRIRF